MSRYVCTRRSTASGALSLSKLRSRPKKLPLPVRFLTVGQFGPRRRRRPWRAPYEIHVDLLMAGAGWVRGPPGRQRARPASILNMPPRAPPAGVCAAGGARRSRTSLAGPGGVPIYFIWESKRVIVFWTPPRAPNPTGSVWLRYFGAANRALIGETMRRWGHSQSSLFLTLQTEYM